MATPHPDFDAIASSTIANYRKTLNENLMGHQALFWQLKQRGFVTEDRGGTSIVEPLLYADNDTVSSYSGYDLLDVTPQDGITSAVYNWKYVAGSVVISGKEEFENSGDKSRIFNLLQAKIRQLELSMKKELNTQLYADGTGNGGKDITGLGLAVEDGTAWSTYGGIDSSAAIASFWRNQYIDATAHQFSFTDGKSIWGLNKMRKMYNLCTRAGFAPTLIVMDLDLYEEYEAYMEGVKQRLTDTKMADAGFKNIMFKDTPVIFDSDLDNNTILFLNADALKFVIGKGRNFTTTPFVRPHNQDAKVSQTLLTANLVTSRRDVQGRIANLAPGTS